MRPFGLLCLGLIVLTANVSAHHGASAFDPSKEVTLTGIVTRLAFSNPHVQLFFDVIDDQGKREAWDGELPAPNTLMRAGWSPRTLKAGDPVTIIGFQGWKGQRSVWIRKMVSRARPLPEWGE